MMLLTTLFEVALLSISVAPQLLGSSYSNAQVVIQNQEQGNLSKPSAYIIGANRTTLVICRANSRGIPNIIDYRVGYLHLHIKCKGLRHNARLPRYFLTTDEDTPPVTTSRLVVRSHGLKKYKQQIICYCVDVATKEKSVGLVISMKPERHQRIWHNRAHFKPKRNRIRTVSLLSSHKISWRFPNSSGVLCFHDGQSLTEDQVVHGVRKISVLINEALRKDAGFYYCRTKSGVFSSWLKLQIKGGWSKWHPWLGCSSRCGIGRKIETRRCLETRYIQKRCQGLSVRALPCFGHLCEVMAPRFMEEPADQEILNASTTNVTCSAQSGSSMFTLQLICSSNNWKTSYSMIQNKTTVGSFSNNTEARIAYKIDLHRDRSGVAVMYCHCYALDRQLTKRSRIAKISFHSVDDGSYNKSETVWPHNFMTSPNSPKTAIRVKAMEPTSSRVSPSLSMSTAVGAVLGASAIVCFVFLSVLAVCLVRIRRKRERCCRNECRRSSDISSPHPRTIESCETETVRHFEPPDTKVITLHSSLSSVDEDTLESRDSKSPLLKHCPDHDELYWPVEPYTSHPSKDTAAEIAFDKSFLKPVERSTSQPSVEMAEETSVFQREESWKSNKSKISAFSSVSAAFCPKPKLPDTVDPDLCAWGRLTPEKGGLLTIEDTGVSLYIPPNALPAEQTSHVIYIGLMNSKGNYPKLSDQQALLSPVVVCGPDGLTFEKPVFLTVPHNAVLDKNNCWNPKVQSCSTEEEGENEWKVLEIPGGDAPFSHVSDKQMQIMIDHFTNFAVVGEVSSSQGAGAQLKSWIVAYFTEPKVDEVCRTRVYCIPATDAAYKVLEVYENKFNGKMSDSQKLLLISNNNKDLQITSKMIHEGWSVIPEERKSIPFNVIWQCIEQRPNVSFVFEPVFPQAFKFLGTFDVRQEESNAGVEVLVSFCIQTNRRASSGYESQANGCQTDVKYKIPIEIRCKLCLLLDPEKPMFNDWRHFAEKLGLGKVYTNNLKDNIKIKSPTNELIEQWEMTMSEKIPLSRIKEIFVEIERDDVVEVLQEIPGLGFQEQPYC